MKIFVTAVLICCNFISPGQTLHPGKFKTHIPIDNSFFYYSSLTLNCDKTFLFADSSITAYGKWEIRKDRLTLKLDSTNKSDLGINVYKNKIELKIKGDSLFSKVATRQGYNNIRKTFRTTAGEDPKLEKYSDFKRRNKYNYFKRAATFSCS